VASGLTGRPARHRKQLS